MRDTFSLPDAVLAFLLEARSNAAPHEACGLLLRGAGGRVEALRTENRSSQPQTSFLIDPQALLRAAVSGRLVGCWHTHPGGSGSPSASDRQAAQDWPDLVHVIVGESVRGWLWSPEGPIPVLIASEGTAGLLWSARP